MLFSDRGPSARKVVELITLALNQSRVLAAVGTSGIAASGNLAVPIPGYPCWNGEALISIVSFNFVRGRVVFYPKCLVIRWCIKSNLFFIVVLVRLVASTCGVENPSNNILEME